jgi:purine-nucleoside phosphorylase
MKPEELKNAARTAVVTGSGLAPGIWPGRVEAEIPYADIDGLHAPTVEGHPGAMMLIATAGGPILVFAGRPHLYEGAGWDPAGMIPAVASGLGCRSIVLTQAAGSLTRDLQTGSWLLPSEIVALPWGSGPSARPGISRRLRMRVAEAAAEAGIAARDGRLYWTAGPAYETPAEASMAVEMGAHAATMSPLPELVSAAREGLEAACMSYITNYAPNVAGGSTGHIGVLEAGRKGSGDLALILPELARL